MDQTKGTGVAGVDRVLITAWFDSVERGLVVTARRAEESLKALTAAWRVTRDPPMTRRLDPFQRKKSDL